MPTDPHAALEGEALDRAHRQPGRRGHPGGDLTALRHLQGYARTDFVT